MRRQILCGALAAAIAAAPAVLRAQPTTEDPAVRAAVERFFAAQEAEDVDAYLALWSSKARKPNPEQLRFVFASGDDTFHDIEITRIAPVGDLLRVLVLVTRQRIDATAKRPDGAPRVTRSRREWSLTFAREGDAVRIVSEGVPADDLADALLAAGTDAERAQLMSAEPNLLNDRLTTALSQRASSLAQQSKFALAHRAYAIVLEVARRSGNRKAEGEALQNVANARYYQGNMAGALAAYDERLVLERAIPNQAGVAGALLGIATVRYSQFEYGIALGHYSEALAILEELDDEMGVATTLISTGNVFYLQGDYDSAIRDYRRSRDLNRKLVHTAGEARALEGLGRTHTAQGDYAAALEAFAGVAEEGRARNDLAMRGNAAQSIGEVHFRLGNLDLARGAFDESRGFFEAMKDLRAAGRVWQGVGLTELVAARFAAAEQAYTRSIAACGAGEDAACVARAIVGLAFAHHSQEHYDEAVAAYRKAIAAFNAQNAHTEAARAEVGLSQSLYGKKQFAAALKAAAHARVQSSVPDVVWRAHLSEARAHRQLKDRARAVESATASVLAVQSMSEYAERLPSQRVPADSADAYAFMAVLHADVGDGASAFAAVEQRRVHALRIALANNERDIARGMTLEEREAERAATVAVISIQVQIDRERELPRPDMSRVDQLNRRLSEAIDARALQQRQLFERLPDLRIWRGLSPAVNADDLAAVLPEAETVLAEFVIDEDELLAVFVSRRDDRVEIGAQTVPITRRALAERIAKAIKPETLDNAVAWRTASADLITAIPPKALEAIAAARRAILVPDDVLWRVPLEALPRVNGYLGDRVEIAYASSVTALVRPLQAEAGMVQVEAPAVLAIGAPVLAPSLLERTKETAPGWTLRVGAGAEREVMQVAAQFAEPPASVLVGPTATEAAFRAAAPAAPALHIALPFRLNSASPLFSPILGSIAAPPGAPHPADPANDGVLEAREVMNLALTAGVAVLSDGAALSMRDGAAATGTLQWAWRAAGVRALLLPRWATDDSSASAMLVEFHRRVAAGASPGAALHAARTAIRANDATRAPWFWAQWMVVGR